MIASAPEIRQITLTDIKTSSPLPPRIALANLAPHEWRGIVLETDKSGIEQGRIISIHEGKIYHGRITEGTGKGSGERASWSPPLFPHGISSWRYMAGMEDLLVLHAHHMPPEVKHVLTSHHSSADLQAFINSTYAASIVIDRGGAHLLTRNANLQNTIPDEEIIKQAYAGQKEVLKVLKELGHSLGRFGIQYHFAKGIDYAENDAVVFTDARFLDQLF